MSNDGFFARYFAALDGPDPHSALELVSDELEFVILFATAPDRRAGHFRGGPEELLAFTDAGDMEGWGHHIIGARRDGDVELVLGETRTEAGEVLGTFVSAAQLDAEGRMVRYLVGRAPHIRFNAGS